MKKRILFVITELGMGGTQKYLVDFIRAMDKGKFEAFVAYRRGGSLEEDLKGMDGVTLVRMKKPKISHWLNFRGFSNFIKENKIALVSTHLVDKFSISSWIAAKILKIPVIHTPQHVYENRRGLENRIVRLRFIFYRFVDAFIAFSNYVGEDLFLNWKMPRDKIRVNCLGVDTDEFRPCSAEKQSELKIKSGIDPAAKVIGVIGRLKPVKGMDSAISVFAGLKKLLKDCKLVIVGDGPIREELVKTALGLGVEKDVVFLGERHDVPDLMGMFDAYLQTTRGPCLGLTTLEALACGKPIIVLARDEKEKVMAMETVTEGVNGIIIREDEDAPRRIADLLKSENSAEMGKASRRLVREKFDITRHVKSMENLFSEIIKGRQGKIPVVSSLNVGSCLKNKIEGRWSIAFDEKKCPQEVLDKVKSALKDDIPADWIALRGSRFSRVWQARSGDKVYVVKEFLSRNPLDPLKAIFCGTRAERAWRCSEKLSEKGFLTPRVIACGKKSMAMLTKRQFIITEFIPDVVGGYKAISLINKLPSKERLEVKWALMKTLGNVIGRLHKEGIIHGDLRPNNILVQGWETAEPSFYFIDNERNSIHKNAPWKLIKKNLVQLNMIKLDSFSLTDRVRFFSAYINAFPDMADKKKLLAKEVWERTKQRLARHGGL